MQRLLLSFCDVGGISGKVGQTRRHNFEAEICAASPSGSLTAQSPDRMTWIASQSRADDSVIVTVVAVIVVPRAQYVAWISPLVGARRAHSLCLSCKERR